MFNDERINFLSGKIYRRGILFATIISTVYLIIKFIFLVDSNELSISSLIFELFTVFAGIFIIIFGESKYSDYEKDERYYNDKSNYYIRKSKLYLMLILLGFALAIPIEFRRFTNWVPLNTLLIYLEIIGLIYFSYSFKINDIYFNYTLIENNKVDYYKGVFKNILKLIAYIFIIYLISIIFAIGIFVGTTYVITVLTIIIISFIVSSLNLSLIYLYISWIEKTNFDEENKSKRYSSTNIILGITAIIVFLLIAISSIDLNYKMVYMSNIESSISIGEAFSKNLKTLKYLSFLSFGISGLLYTYLLARVKESKNAKVGIKIHLLATVINIFVSFISLFLPILYSKFNVSEMYNYISRINYIINLVITISKFIGIIFVFSAFVKDFNFKKYIYIIPILGVVFEIISLILSLNLNTYQLSLFNHLTNLISLSLYLTLFTFVTKNRLNKDVELKGLEHNL